MSKRIIKKLELSMEFLDSYESTKERLNRAEVNEFTISDYIDFLYQSVSAEQLEAFIDSKIPLRVKLLNALEIGDETLMSDLNKLLDKQARLKAKKNNTKDSIEA